MLNIPPEVTRALLAYWTWGDPNVPTSLPNISHRRYLEPWKQKIQSKVSENEKGWKSQTKWWTNWNIQWKLVTGTLWHILFRYCMFFITMNVGFSMFCMLYEHENHTRYIFTGLVNHKLLWDLSYKWERCSLIRLPIILSLYAFNNLRFYILPLPWARQKTVEVGFMIAQVRHSS